MRLMSAASSTAVPYTTRRASRSHVLRVRTLDYHLRIWGEPQPGVAPIWLLHGWMDVSASFQFVVDALEDTPLAGRHIVAPDWRGYGPTHQANPGVADNYWFPDYMADLEALLDAMNHGTPDAPVDLVAHSMGGNVAMVYAGVRPERVRKLVNLEGFGQPRSKPELAPKRYADWMDQLKACREGQMDLKPYESAERVAQRLMKNNPRLAADKAAWLATHWAAPDSEGKWAILGDAAHKIVNANLYQVDEVLACWARITAPTLWVEGSETDISVWWGNRFTKEEARDRLKAVPSLQSATIANAAHMLHHDQPEALATVLARFLA
jgi:pimeloyl-ACP methyl ester carboxylesterase